MTRIHDELRHKGLTTSKEKFVCALTVALPKLFAERLGTGPQVTDSHAMTGGAHG